MWLLLCAEGGKHTQEGFAKKIGWPASHTMLPSTCTGSYETFAQFFVVFACFCELLKHFEAFKIHLKLKKLGYSNSNSNSKIGQITSKKFVWMYTNIYTQI